MTEFKGMDLLYRIVLYLLFQRCSVEKLNCQNISSELPGRWIPATSVNSYRTNQFTDDLLEAMTTSSKHIFPSSHPTARVQNGPAFAYHFCKQ